MNKKVIYIGLDVDDTQYHGAAFDKGAGEIVSFKCRPTLKGLIAQLEKMQKYFETDSLKLCYEASYIGHCLQRDLMQAGYDCDVISPGSIPRKGSKSIKTDRIDALDLAQFYANDLLTIVQVPNAATEQDRDLLRSRQQLMKQQNDLRRHIQSLLRRNGLHYKAETNNKTPWTKHHCCWLERTVEGCSGSLGTNLQLLLRQLESINEIVSAYSEEIELMAKRPNYQQAVSALVCYKGIKNLFALTMITEIGRCQTICASETTKRLGRYGYSGIFIGWKTSSLWYYKTGQSPFTDGVY